MSDWLHSPHVGTSGQLKGRHNLGFDCALQNTQSSVLAVPAQHCQLKVGLSLVDELCEIRYTEHECHASTSTSPPTHSEADHSKSQAFSDVKHYENNVHAATQLYNDRVLVIPWSHRFVLQLVLSSDCTVVTTITMIRATKRPGLIFSPTSCPLATSCMSTQRHGYLLRKESRFSEFCRSARSDVQQAVANLLQKKRALTTTVLHRPHRWGVKGVFQSNESTSCPEFNLFSVPCSFT